MSKVHMLRCLVNQRLAAAVEEVFGLFERTIAEYEEEIRRSTEEKTRQQKLLDAVLNPEVCLHRADVQQLVKEEHVPEQQKRSSSLNQENPPEPAYVKEEREELWSYEEYQAAEEAAASRVPFTLVCFKSEEDDEGTTPSSQPHESQTGDDGLKTEAEGEGCGGSDPDQDLNPYRYLHTDAPAKSLPCPGSDADVNGDLEQGLNPLQNNSRAVSEMDCNSGNTSVIFSECAQSFGVKTQNHEGIHTGEKAFTCLVCGKEFKGKKQLQQHKHRHSAVKPFSCSVCKRGFLKRTEVVRHMRVHTGEKPFSCSVCGKSFSQHIHLMQHSFTHAGEKPFSCSVCGKRFTQNGKLKRHAVVHTGEKPFSCLICGKSYTQQESLRQHSIIHTGEKPFSCKVCGKKFALNGYLKRHSLVHMGELT